MDLAITQSMMKQNGNTTHSIPGERNTIRRKPISQSHQLQDKNDNDLINNLESDSEKKQVAIDSLIKTANEKLNFYVNNENVKKPEPVEVQLFLVFLRVGEIDNVKQRFQADAYFEACWEDDTIDPKANFDPRHHWDPELFIENSVGNLKQDIKYKIERKDSKTKVFEMRMIKGIFWEKLELWDFPLDIQDLTITISSSRDQKEIRFEPSTYSESVISTEDFQQQQEWNLYSHIFINKKFIYDVCTKHERPCFSISANIARRPGYYIYNAYMLMFLISVLGFVPFSFPCTAPHFRIQTTLLLILSSFNFRLICTQKLPTVSYLTTLDKYAIGALVFLVSLCCWHAVIGTTGDLFKNTPLKNPSFRCELDVKVLCGIATVYLTLHLVYILFFLFKYSRYAKLNVEEIEPEPEPEPVKLEFEPFESLDINSDKFFEKQKSIVLETKTPTLLTSNHLHSSLVTTSYQPSNTQVRHSIGNQIQYMNLINYNNVQASPRVKSSNQDQNKMLNDYNQNQNQDIHMNEVNKVSNPFAQQNRNQVNYRR